MLSINLNIQMVKAEAIAQQRQAEGRVYSARCLCNDLGHNILLSSSKSIMY